MIRRREFITLLGSAATWPLAAGAQQRERMRRIGVLMSSAADDPEAPTRVTAIAQGLQELGWTVGRNLSIDYRWGAGDIELFRKYAAELVALKPDVILATAGSIVGAVQQVSRTVPIVFVTTIDPVGGGWVESLARPGGNATGFTSYEFSMSGKRLELLKEIAPLIRRVAVIRDPRVPAGSGGFAAIQTAAPGLGVEATPIGVRDADEIERGVSSFARGENGGLIVVGPPSSIALHRDLIIALATRHRLPAVYTSKIIRRLRWSDLLRHRSNRPVSECRRLRAPHSPGRKSRRPSGASADQVRAGDQPQDRDGAWHRGAADAARTRRRGDRMMGWMAPLRHLSAKLL